MLKRRPAGRGRTLRRGSAVGRRIERRRSASARRRSGAARPRARARTEVARPSPPPAGGDLQTGILLAVGLLAGLGIVMIYSATAPLAIGEPLPPHFIRHLAVSMLALGAGLAAWRVPIRLWQLLALPLWAGSLGLLALTLAVGVEVNGARRWIELPGLPMRLQAGELARWTAVVAMAAVLARRGATPAGLRAVAALALLPAGLLLAQPDFGSAALLVATAGVMLFAAGLPLAQLLLPALSAGAGAAVYVLLRPYALARWSGFLDPWSTPHGQGFQLIQSFIAFGRGGAAGVGLGDGRQKLFYLPEAHTDFMLSVIAEELGLIGVWVVLGAFAWLVVTGARVAGRAREPFVLLLAFGLTAFVTVPAAINAAVVMGLVPTTGFPLPFLSFGGASLFCCALAVGVLLRIAGREARLPEARIGGAERRSWVRP